MQEVNKYDVAIVGGGLAGLCLAIQSAGNGCSTILFEKEKYPFHKVCGEYISMESYGFLQSLGVDLEAFKVPHINKLTITNIKGKPYHFKLPLGGFGISRYTLDAALYNIAILNGVKVVQAKVQDIVYENDAFIIHNNEHACIATIAAGSFGKRSNLDIKWKRKFTTKNAEGKNYVAFKYHVKYPHPIDTIALHNFKDGYCGISAIEDDKCCVCYLTSADQLKAAGNSVSRLQNEFLAVNPCLKDIFSSATFLYAEPLAISQISFAAKNIVQDHILLAGDAAGLITPLCGNGMSMAMNASKICAATIKDYFLGNLSRKQMETEYVAKWKHNFARRLQVGRTVQNFFGNPGGTAAFLKVMNAVPLLSKAVIKSTHGEPF